MIFEMYYTSAAVVVCGAATLWYLLTFNVLVQSRNAVDQAWSNIEVELKRRFDLIQNLVETVRGYARHESETFRGVAALRNVTRPFADASSANAAQPEMTQAVAQVMMLAESYPQLRADQGFLKLHGELVESENRIAARRHAYNRAVNLYRNRCQLVPMNLVAGLHRMPPKVFFDAPDELADAAPQVKL